jgi:hypothetical protein
MTRFSFLLILALPLHAQTAKVIQLSPADAAEAKALHAQRDAINKKIDDLQKKITDKYLSVEKPGSGNFLSYSGPVRLCMINAGCPPETPEEKKRTEEADKKWRESENLKHHLERIPGWDDFQFSEDFKFIVPVEKKYVPPSGTTFMVNPAWVAN